MAKPFKNLMQKMSPESRERIRKRTAQMHSEMTLQELRQALHLAQLTPICPVCENWGGSPYTFLILHRICRPTAERSGV